MKMNKSLLIATSLLATIALQAQEIKVKDKNVEQSEGTLLVGMTLDFSEVDVPAGRSIVCTPVVASGDSIRPLTPIILNGRDRHILYERTGRTYATHGEYAPAPHERRVADLRLHRPYPDGPMDETRRNRPRHRRMRLRMGNAAERPFDALPDQLHRTDRVETSACLPRSRCRRGETPYTQRAGISRLPGQPHRDIPPTTARTPASWLPSGRPSMPSKITTTPPSPAWPSKASRRPKVPTLTTAAWRKDVHRHCSTT